MLGRRALTSAVLVLCSLRVWALPVHLAFDWPAGMRAPAQIRLHAALLASDAGEGMQVEADAGPGGIVLDLSPGVWQIQAFAPGFWSQGAQITVGGQPSIGAQITFWPAASLHGEIVTAPGEALPRALDVRLDAVPASGGSLPAEQTLGAAPTPSPAHAELNCPIEGERWSCLGPAGRFDVRLKAAGESPEYQWGVLLTAARDTDLGPTKLERTLSVFGRAVQKDGSAPAGPCRAPLEPDAERSSGPGSEPDNPPPGEKVFTVALNGQGYFQIAGVMPGRHLLDVECPAASGVKEVQVQPSGETRVDPPVVLQDVTLAIVITPRTDPAGQAWRLAVEATSPRLRRISSTAMTAADGSWIRRGLMAGSYRATISSSDGMEWLRKDFDLEPGSGPVVLHLASVKVAGRVLLNEQPVRARLFFSNQSGGDPITLHSDDQGNFQGRLPIAAGAEESWWSVEAHVAKPQTVRRLANVDVPTVAAGTRAWLDLALPMIPVRGTVVSQDGQPQHGAQVTVEGAGSGEQMTTSTDDAGRFEVNDLPPGQYKAVARSMYGVSTLTPFSVTDDSENDLRLILRPNLHIPLYVVSQDGPISDATVQVWMAPGVPHALAHTDQNGRIEVSLPPGTTEVGLTVGAEGYAIQLIKMAVPSTAGPADPPSDQNTVTLHATGGTMELNFEPPDGTLDPSATLYVVHDGAIADARTLAGWGTDEEDSSSDDPAEVDGIEPGDYALCVVTDPSQLTPLWQGSVPPRYCSKGTVTTGQTLRLAPPQ
jgi:hypothetical protein